MVERDNDLVEKTERVQGQKESADYDLSERTARFGEEVIRFLRSIKFDPITTPLVKQLVRSSTSVGANYAEANEAGSRKEFRYRISVCGREARESRHWLRMIAAASPPNRDTARSLWQEAKELTLIFAAIYRNTPEKK